MIGQGLVNVSCFRRDYRCRRWIRGSRSCQQEAASVARFLRELPLCGDVRAFPCTAANLTTVYRLKYYWLLFSDNDVIALDDYVFNTEASAMIYEPVGRSLISLTAQTPFRIVESRASTLPIPIRHSKSLSGER